MDSDYEYDFEEYKKGGKIRRKKKIMKRKKKIMKKKPKKIKREKFIEETFTVKPPPIQELLYKQTGQANKIGIIGGGQLPSNIPSVGGGGALVPYASKGIINPDQPSKINNDQENIIKLIGALGEGIRKDFGKVGEKLYGIEQEQEKQKKSISGVYQGMSMGFKQLQDVGKMAQGAEEKAQEVEQIAQEVEEKISKKEKQAKQLKINREMAKAKKEEEERKVQEQRREFEIQNNPLDILNQYAGDVEDYEEEIEQPPKQLSQNIKNFLREQALRDMTEILDPYRKQELRQGFQALRNAPPPPAQPIVDQQVINIRIRTLKGLITKLNKKANKSPDDEQKLESYKNELIQLTQ